MSHVFVFVDVYPVMSEDNLKEIIDAFLRRNAKVLTDQELSATIVQAGRTCSIEEIHQTVQRIGSSLFQRSCDKDGTYFIRIEPKVNEFDRMK